MALTRRAAKRAIAYGEAARNLYQSLSVPGLDNRSFSTAAALRHALGDSKPKREASRELLGVQAYRRIIRAGVKNRAQRKAVLETVKHFGWKGDGSKDPARLFAHVFGRLPEHPVDYFVRGGLLVFALRGPERGILSKQEWGMFFGENTDEVVPKALRGAVAVVLAKPSRGFSKTLAHEQAHHFVDLDVARPLHLEAYAATEFADFASNNRPSRKNIERLKALARRCDLEWVKEEALARFREGTPPKQIMEKVRDAYVRQNRRALSNLLNDRWRAAVGGDLFGRASASAFMESLVNSMQRAVRAGVDRETVVHTAMVTGYKDVPAVMRALIRAHGGR